ncbi:hypothetical protein JXQ31_16285 [candidate division KSB1 bacterium]|nr:hypothetical protein [candidate division KSB1 bacterium]
MCKEWDYDEINNHFKYKREDARKYLDRLLFDHKDVDTVQDIKLNNLIDFYFYGYFYNSEYIKSKDSFLNELKKLINMPPESSPNSHGKPPKPDLYIAKWNKKVQTYIDKYLDK